MNYLVLLIVFNTIKAGFIIALITAGMIGLGPDEAQYWTWSQALDWGYYSKPPGVAWQIWLGTQLFGNTELGVRFCSVVISFLISLSVYFLAKACKLSSSTAFWAGMAMAFCPLGMAASILATTDGGLVLFWTLASIFMALALNSSNPLYYYLIGVMIFFGALFKWPIYFFWALACMATFFNPNIRSYHLLGGMAFSLFALFPSIIWNSSHEWATFRHVSTTMLGGHGKEIGTFPLMHGNFVEFLGAQAVLLSPIWFGLLVLASVVLIKDFKTIPHSIRFCGVSSLLIISGFLLVSFFQKMQGNWCVFVHPSAIVFLCWFANEYVPWGRKWLIAGLPVSLLLCALAISSPFFPIPFKMNPFKHNLGWDSLNLELASSGYDPDKHFLFSDKYQMCSILSFYSPGQQRAYFLNLEGVRKNQFSFWPSMQAEQLGNTGFFVITENSPHLERSSQKRIHDYHSLLENYFDDVEYLGTKPLFQTEGKMVKGALLFKCHDYNGKTPIETKIY